MHDVDSTLNINEAEYEFTFPSEGEEEYEYESLGEMETLEKAAQLLGVSNEEELDNFLGDLIKSAGKAISNFAHSSTGQALGGILKGAVKKVLPLAGGALGGVVGGPAGAAIGSSLASTAGQALGLELEGLSPEDREFEVAQQLVRLGADAASAAAAAHGAEPPHMVARKAFIQSAQKHAPGLIQPISGSHATLPIGGPRVPAPPTPARPRPAPPREVARPAPPHPTAPSQPSVNGRVNSSTHMAPTPASGRWVRSTGEQIILLGV
jgi:uncharacterized protein (DUF697 family)